MRKEGPVSIAPTPPPFGKGKCGTRGHHYPEPSMTDTSEDTPEAPTPQIAFLGPSGTFGEESLRALDFPTPFDPVPMRTMPEALGAVQNEEVQYAFVALENSIEGTVNVSLDALIFDNDLVIQREVISEIHLCLLAPKGVKMKDIKRVVSFPVAIGQCREFLSKKLPGVEVIAANSTSDAARQVSKTTSTHTAAVGTKLSAEIYGLQVLQEDIADHEGNQTRFVLVAKNGIPAPTGHDKTSIVVFQHDNKPGNLHAYLGQFSARNINLTKLESRPTKRALGDYCFVIDLEGHIDSEVIADCLRDLHVQAGSVKFLGSYPAAGAHGQRRRRDAVAAWRAADEWVTTLRSQVAPNPKKTRRLKVVK
jgi:prephenate dehydratase